MHFLLFGSSEFNILISPQDWSFSNFLHYQDVQNDEMYPPAHFESPMVFWNGDGEFLTNEVLSKFHITGTYTTENHNVLCIMIRLWCSEAEILFAVLWTFHITRTPTILKCILLGILSRLWCPGVEIVKSPLEENLFYFSRLIECRHMSYGAFSVACVVLKWMSCLFPMLNHILLCILSFLWCSEVDLVKFPKDCIFWLSTLPGMVRSTWHMTNHLRDACSHAVGDTSALNGPVFIFSSGYSVNPNSNPQISPQVASMMTFQTPQKSHDISEASWWHTPNILNL